MTSKKTRRIEITAFRQTTRISRHAQQIKLSMEFSPDQTDCLTSTDDGPARIEQFDVIETVLSSVDDPGLPELPRFVEQLVVSVGDIARAAQRVGWGRNGFYSKLRSLGLSVKNLKSIRGESVTKAHRSQQGEPK